MPAKDYNVLSGFTRSKQESHKGLQRPVGTWSQNQNEVDRTSDMSKGKPLLQMMKRVTIMPK